MVPDMSGTSLILLNLILAFMMYGIALSLTVDDFRRILVRPKGPLTGIFAQFILLPAASWGLTMLVDMPAEIALGIILVGSCPGGSFSNIMTHLARGNTALSVSMTGISSIGAALMTPASFVFYSGLNPDTAALLKEISVPAQNILLLVGLVLIVPLILGLITARLSPGFAARSDGIFRMVSLAVLFVFVGVTLGKHWQVFVSGIGSFFFIVILHNALALSVGRLSARLMKLNTADSRAVTLEVGIQNSGLGLGIIFTFFDQLSGMAIIAAAWGIWHLVSGLSLTAFWNLQDRKYSAGNNKKNGSVTCQ